MNVIARACSAMMRSETSVGSLGAPGRRARDAAAAASISGRNTSMSQIDVLPCTTSRMRSSPAPVSMLGFGQRRRGAVGSLVVLHEHEVPDLDVAVVVGRRTAARAPNSGPRSQKISDDGPHGPVSPMLPEVVSSPRRWMRSAGKPTSSRQMRSASSSSSCTVTHSRLGVESEHVGDELPRPRDRVGLEVVAEAEVAEHLEEREVAVRAADVVEVVVLAAGAHALLRRRRPLVRRRLLADEVAS